MGQKYGQLSLDERCEIARLQAAGCSRRAIAEALGRNPATIGRELTRNTDRDVGYKPAKAQHKADERCWKGAKLARDEDLREEVLAALKRGWSPEQVAGRLGEGAGRRVISHESIYRFIYAQMRRSNDGAWRNYLPRAKACRGRRGRKGGSSVKTFKDRVSIDERPASVASRLRPGHWEADLMAFSRMGQTLLLAHERKTRFILLARQPAKRSDSVIARLSRWLGVLPPRLRRSMTFDNGTEFAFHYRLGASLGVKTFFCDPHSPWQKGGTKTPSGVSGASCHARQTSPHYPPAISQPPLTATTPPHARHLAGRPPPRHSPDTSTCCTSNVNPHPRLRGGCVREFHPNPAESNHRIGG